MCGSNWNTSLPALPNPFFACLKKLESIKQGGSFVTVNWHYDKDDKDMLHAVEDYCTVIDLPINVVAIPD